LDICEETLKTRLSKSKKVRPRGSSFSIRQKQCLREKIARLFLKFSKKSDFFSPCIGVQKKDTPESLCLNVSGRVYGLELNGGFE